LKKTDQYNNRKYASQNEFGTINQQNSYSASKSPCQTYSYKIDFKGKRRDVKITETFCDGIQYSQKGNNNVFYAKNNNVGYNNHNFGKTNNAQDFTQSTDFADVFTDKYNSRSKYSGSSLYNNLNSNRYSRDSFSWLYNY
jgi:hypothetical protein